MEWQPIETAPKDGNNLLLWMDRKDYRAEFCCIGRWSCTSVDHLLGSRWLCDDSCKYAWATGFYGDPPTHWMPLPDPPKSP